MKINIRDPSFRVCFFAPGWHDLWDQNVIPWHKTDVNPKLVKHLDAAIEATGKTDPSEIRILVPLCGKSVDLMYLYEKGFTVVGVEFNDTAARDFFTENKLAVDKSVVGNFTFYKVSLIVNQEHDVF